ncbi:MAG: hypothetical protein J5711_01755 [Bacteroidales bacterium]|nr:hypothetical protein [Bacteroidales bacterium]
MNEFTEEKCENSLMCSIGSISRAIECLAKNNANSVKVGFGWDLYRSELDGCAQVADEAICDSEYSTEAKNTDGDIVVSVGIVKSPEKQICEVKFRNLHGSNLLIYGTDVKSALSTLAIINHQLCRLGKSVIMVDFFPRSSRETKYLQDVAKACGMQYADCTSAESVVAQMEDTLNSRIEDACAGKDTTQEPIFLTMAYLQGAINMQPDGYRDSEMSLKVQRILKHGPDYGIHLIVYSYSYRCLQDMVQNSDGIRYFGYTISLSGSDRTRDYDIGLGPRRYAVLRRDDAGIAAYKQEFFVAYNKYADGEANDPVLDLIFSMFKE